MIKNLIFDFGGVLINLDKEAVPTAVTAMGRSPEDPDLLDLSMQYEKGLITTDHFLLAASQRLNLNDLKSLKEVWNRTILDFPNHRLSYLQDLKSTDTFRMYLLSNTNELHMDYVRQQMGAVRYQRFQNCFHGFYLSYEMGMRKPEPEIFQEVLNNHGLNADETLFIDDTEEHILSAASLGLQTWNLQPESEDITELPKKIRE